MTLIVYRRIQFVHLGDIWLTIQHSTKYLFGFLIILLDFVLTGGVVIFDGMWVLCNVVSLGGMWVCAMSYVSMWVCGYVSMWVSLTVCEFVQCLMTS